MTTAPNTPDVSDTSDLDPQSLAAIRDLLATEPQAKPKPVKERVAEKAAAAMEPVADAPAGAARPSMPSKKTKTQVELPHLQPDASAKAEGPVSRLRAKVTGYRPRPKHIAIAALLLFVVFLPWLVVGLLFLSLFVTTAVFLILGYDGFWHRVMGVSRWYARRHPSRSAEIHSKLDGFAVKFDAFLDRFPEGSVDGLYLPDFGDLAEANARHDEALDRRFDSMRESEV